LPDYGQLGNYLLKANSHSAILPSGTQLDSIVIQVVHQTIQRPKKRPSENTGTGFAAHVLCFMTSYLVRNMQCIIIIS